LITSHKNTHNWFAASLSKAPLHPSIINLSPVYAILPGNETGITLHTGSSGNIKILHNSTFQNPRWQLDNQCLQYAVSSVVTKINKQIWNFITMQYKN